MGGGGDVVLLYELHFVTQFDSGKGAALAPKMVPLLTPIRVPVGSPFFAALKVPRMPLAPLLVLRNLTPLKVLAPF